MSTIIQFEPEALRSMVQAVVSEMLRAVEADRAQIARKLAYTEPEVRQKREKCRKPMVQ